MADKEIVLNVKSDIGSVVKDAEALKDEIKGAKKQTDKLAESASGATTQTKQLGKAAKKSGGGFKKLKTVVQGVGMALKAAGIGLVVAIVAKLMEVFGSNQKVLDTFNTAMTALTKAFNDLFTFLSNNIGTVTQIFKDLFENPQEQLKKFGDMIKNNLIERFNSLIDTFGYLAASLGELFAGNFKEAGRLAKEAGKEMIDVATGVDDTFGKAKEIIKETTDAVINYAKETWNGAAALTAAEKAAKLAAAEFEKLNAEYLKEQEDQRQIRDDITKTYAVRLEANEKLAASQKKQFADQEALLKVEENAAKLRWENSKLDDDRLAYLAKSTDLLKLQESINAQESEQKTNQVALEQELLDAQKELALVGKEAMDLELAELKQNYEAKLDLARRAGVDKAAVDEEYEKMKAEIEDRYADEQKAKDDADRAEKLAVMQGMYDNISSMLQSSLDAQAGEIETNYQQEKALAEKNGKDTTAIDQKFDKKKEALAAKQKKLAVALATVEMFKSVIAAYNQGMNVPAPAGLVLGPLAAGMALAAGIANINSILKTPIGGGGSAPSGNDAGAAAGGASPAPQMMSGKFELGGAIEQEPTKAYVVTDEMTNSQNQLANIRRRSTI